MDVALREVQGECQQDVWADPHDGVVREEHLGAEHDLLLVHLQGSHGGRDLLLADEDVGLVRVEDVEGVGHPLEEEDGALREVVEGVYSVVVVRIDLEVVGRVHYQHILASQRKRHHLHAVAHHLHLAGFIGTGLPFAIDTPGQLLKSFSFLFSKP